MRERRGADGTVPRYRRADEGAARTAEVPLPDFRDVRFAQTGSEQGDLKASRVRETFQVSARLGLTK